MSLFLFFTYWFRLGADLSACRPKQRAEGAAGVEGTEPEGAAFAAPCSLLLAAPCFAMFPRLQKSAGDQ